MALLGNGARGRSTWNTYDVRGVVEEVLSGLDVLGDPAAYDELVEDIAVRAETGCVSVIDRAVDRAVPVHVRHLTSPGVVELERDLRGRFAARSIHPHRDADVHAIARVLPREVRLDAAQVAAVAALGGTAPLALIEDAAGSGKTTMVRSSTSRTVALMIPRGTTSSRTSSRARSPAHALVPPAVDTAGSGVPITPDRGASGSPVWCGGHALPRAK